jgi:hypothetical protein
LWFKPSPGQIVYETLSQKKPITKKSAGGVAQGVGPEFKSRYHRKKKKSFQSFLRNGTCLQNSRSHIERLSPFIFLKDLLLK